MGRMQRDKGKKFERRIAIALRERWPDAEVRRASQADRAWQSDVFVSANGAPLDLARIWWECQHAAKPTPLAKLKQAELDIASSHCQSDRLAVVVWHRNGDALSHVTMRLHTLDKLRGRYRVDSTELITLELGAFLDVIAKHNVPRETRRLA